MKRLTITILMVLLNTCLCFAQCGDILKQNIIKKYNFKSDKKYSESVEKLFSMSYDELKTYKESHGAGIDILSGFIGGIFSFGADYAQEKERYEKIRMKYKGQSKIKVDASDEVEISMEAADENIIKAWQDCVKLKGLITEIAGETCESFIFTIDFIPKTGDESKKPLKVNNIIYSDNVTPEDKSVFKKLKINPFSSFSHRFTKQNDKPATIVVNFEGMGSLTSNSKDCTPPDVDPPDPPQPKYADVWYDRDEAGNLLTQTFDLGLSPNRHNISAVTKSGEFTIAYKENSPTIYKVDYRGSGYGCMWSYNPDGGYDAKWVLLNPKTFQWERRWAGEPCTETYKAYFKILKRVCVENCH